MARSSKGAASARLSELDIIGGPSLTSPQPNSSEPTPEPPVITPEGPGAGEEGTIEANLSELDAALGGAGENGGEEDGQGAPGDSGGGEAPGGPTPNRALVSVPTRTARRPRRKASEPKLRVEIELPEDVLARAKASVRTQFTGMERSQGQKFVFAAYVLAVDDLVGGAGVFDLQGIETVEDMAERVKMALAETLAVSPESAAA